MAVIPVLFEIKMMINDMNDKKNNSIRYFSVSTFLLTGKQMMLAMMLACSPLAMSAQKISLGSCITRDGGQYKGEMVSGKPQGKGSTIIRMVILTRVPTSRESAADMAYILSRMARDTKDSGCRTSSTARVPITSRTIISM